MNPGPKHTIQSTQQCAQTKLHKNAKNLQQQTCML
jgi:hypothetical protein